MRYCPVSSVTPVRTLVMSAGLDASMVTPGSTAPDVSRTVPARLCAVARLGPAPTMATTMNTRISVCFMSENLLDRWGYESDIPSFCARMRGLWTFRLRVSRTWDCAYFRLRDEVVALRVLRRQGRS